MKKIFFLATILFSGLLLAGAGCLSLTGGGEDFQTSGPAGFFLSADKGESWRSISLLPQTSGVENLNSVSVYRMVADPQDAGALYWASRAHGLFFSYNEGQSWQRSPAPLNVGFVYSVAIHPEDKCKIFSTDGYRVYFSEDCNRSWQEVYREDQATARIAKILIEPFGSHRVFLGKINGDLLVSGDEGGSWTVVKRFGSRIGDVAADAASPNIIYVATNSDGLFRSEDGGINWVNRKEALSVYPGALKFRSLYVHPIKKDTLYWISTYGILYSTNQGESWDAYKLITSPGSVDIYAFAINPKNDKEIYYTATLKNRSTFYRTDDGGKTWSTNKLPSAQIPYVLRVHPEKENVIYLGFTIPTTK
jgi:photosystem II stability/assembly factor-like uncharacterized protein